MALGTSDPLSTELFISRKRKLYKGRGLAIVKTIGEKGEFIFKVTGESLGTSEIIIKCI